jgi:Na+-transporting NADH:ubiquinone oxidoreductase subunit C
MSNKNESFGRTVFVVVALCFVCALIVSSAAVFLKPMQEQNMKLDKQKNILKAAGYDANPSDGKKNVKDMTSDEVFDTFAKVIDVKIVNLATGEYNTDLDPDVYDESKAMFDVAASFMAKPNDAAVQRVANNMSVYLAKNEQGSVDALILSLRGKGLWDQMYAFIALENDLNTIQSLIYYKQKETAGLGAEVQNVNWQKLWTGKKVYDASGNVAIEVTKLTDVARSDYGVDALSGATLTGNGVTGTMKFWFGEQGYKPYLLARRQEGLN